MLTAVDSSIHEVATSVGVSSGVVKLYHYCLRERGLISLGDDMGDLYLSALDHIKHRKDHTHCNWGVAIGEYISKFKPHNHVTEKMVVHVDLDQRMRGRI